jgi:hypothetical protein
MVALPVMPLPAELKGRIRKREFWTNAYWLTYPDDEAEDLAKRTIRFEVTDCHALVLGLDDGFYFFSLGLSVDGADPIDLGWDDQAHWHPHVLRWRELDAIGGAVARRDPSLVHPGVPLLLLMRFAPITDEVDGGIAHHLIGRAWDRLGLFSRREREAFFDRIDARGAGFTWRRTELGHVIEQDEGDRFRRRALYSLRAPGSEEFPLEELEAMLASIPSFTTIPPGTVLPPRPVSLSIQLSCSPSFPSEAARFVALFMNRALRDAGEGNASVGGGCSNADGTCISWIVGVEVRGDERLARTRATNLLDACGALEAAMCYEGELVPSPEPRTYLQLCNLELARWGDGNVRFDRPELGQAQRRAIAETLDHLGFCEENDAGVRSVTLPDGCRIEAFFPDLSTDENLDGGSLWLDRVTGRSAEVVYALMKAASLFVASPLIAPSAELAASVNTPWPGTSSAADAEELRALLGR